MVYAAKATEGLCKLPLFRPVAVKILKLLCQEDVDFTEIAGLLKSDPGFSAEILAMANSSLYGSRSQIHTLLRAILVLGLERTKAITMTVAMQAFVRNLQSSPELQNSWRHSIGSALIAEELAPAYGLPKDYSYTAALLHDIGRLGLLAAYTKVYSGLLAKEYEDVAEILTAEKQAFEMNHCEAGLFLTKAWGFPEDFWQIAMHHHGPHLGAGNDIIALVRVSCALADALEFGSFRCRSPIPAVELVRSLPAGGRNFSLEGLQTNVLEKYQQMNLR